MLTVRFTRPDGSSGQFDTLCRIDTENEIDYFYAGGILPYVLRKLAS
jgi:aconitate hydratase